MNARVGVNLLWLVPGVVGGSEEYSVRTIEALVDRRPEGLELTLFTQAAFVDAHPELCDRVPVRTLPMSHNRVVRVAAENTWLAWSTRGFDLVHHVGGRSPAIRPARTVVTVHDLQPLVYPEHFGAVKARYLRHAIPRSVAAATMVVAPSEFVRTSLIDRYGLDPGTVVSVSAGYDVPRLPAPDDAGLDPAIRGLLGERFRFFVYPAVTHPHKNHAVLLKAMAELVAEGRHARLVLTGATGAAGAQVAGLVAELGLGHHVLHLGRIDRASLDLLISRAEALVFPSLHEGFGIPTLEAMALGCPVIAADATAVPEVVGSAGILVPPDDVDAWVDALRGRLDGRPPRAEAAAAGRERAAQFAHDVSGAKLEDVYRRALADRR